MLKGLNPHNRRWRNSSLCSGAGLIEVMLALLVFSTAMTGTLAAQALGMRASAAALQRTSAALYAQDLLARVRSNPGAVHHYVAAELGGAENRQLPPRRDCERHSCSPAELAAYDLWHWERQLLGIGARIGEHQVGGLYLPTACLFHDSGRVTLYLHWRGVGHAQAVDAGECGSSDRDGLNQSGHAAVTDYWRGNLVISTAIERVVQ